jgi:hypothetical protein
MTKISSRSREVAEAIRDRKPFETYGALRATRPNYLSTWDAGRLSGDDLARFEHDSQSIRYVVWSYATPIAWVTEDGTAYSVRQRFSVTTSQHQGKLYLLGD